VNKWLEDLLPRVFEHRSVLFDLRIPAWRLLKVPRGRLQLSSKLVNGYALSDAKGAKSKGWHEYQLYLEPDSIAGTGELEILQELMLSSICARKHQKCVGFAAQPAQSLKNTGCATSLRYFSSSVSFSQSATFRPVPSKLAL
jgi:hypothetical protein